MVAVGEMVPEFESAANGGASIALSSLRGKTVVLYFYPKDNTKGCTTEAQDFRDNYDAFRELNVEILGVSRDSVKSHDNFVAKQELPFPLLSDPDETLCGIFDVIKEKNMYGRKVLGIVRSTFVIDGEGTLIRERRKVRVKGHVEEVLAYIGSLNAE